MVKLVTYIPENEQPPRGSKTSRTFVIDGAKVKIMAGTWEMSEEDIKILDSVPVAKLIKKQGALLVGESKIETSTEVSLKDLDPKEAIALVGQTTSLLKLKTWQQDEPGSANRKTVLNAIAIQIEKIEKGKL